MILEVAILNVKSEFQDNFQKDFILFGYSQIHEIYPQLEYIYQS